MKTDLNKILIVSLHDLHPESLSRIAAQVHFFENLGVRRFSILAIPYYHAKRHLKEDHSTLRWIDGRVNSGDDIVLHGYYHHRHDRQRGSWFYTKVYTANEAEFLDLPDIEVERRLKEGAMLWKERQWPLRGFIAPAWLMPQQQDILLSRLGLIYTTRLGGIYRLQKKDYIATQSLCYSTRSRWRRSISLAWNGSLFKRLRKKSVIRLSLHPNDLEHISIRRQIEHMTQQLLSDGYQSLSYADYAQM